MAGGFGDPMMGPSGFGDPMAGGFGDPMMGTFNDPYAGTFNDPMMGTFNDPMMGTFNDPMMGTFSDPMAGTYIDPYAGTYIDPYAGTYIDPYAGTYIDPYAPVYNTYVEPVTTFTEVLTATTGNDALVGGDGGVSFTMGQGTTLGGVDSVSGGTGDDQLTLTSLDNINVEIQATSIVGDGTMTVRAGTAIGSGVETATISMTSVDQLYFEASGISKTIPTTAMGNAYVIVGSDGAADELDLGSASLSAPVIGTILMGKGGNDSLVAYSGSTQGNLLVGGDGNDYLAGQVGTSDEMEGGTGTDTFFLRGAGNTDMITDFSSVEGDKIRFDATLVNGTVTSWSSNADGDYIGALSSDNFVANGTPFSSNHYFYTSYDAYTSTSTLFYDADGNGVDHNWVAVAILNGVSSLSSSDIELDGGTSLPSGRVEGVRLAATNPVTVAAKTGSDGSDGYGVGETIQITVNYKSAVDVSGTPVLGINTGGINPVYATYQSGTGTSALLFEYTVQEGDPSVITATAATIGINGTVTTSGGSESAETTFSEILSGVTIDGDAPDALNATVSGTPTGVDGVYVNGNGQIDDITELFSEYFAEGKTTGLGALSTLDENGDGIIDQNDSQFADLQIWRDLNQDGISQSDELKSLADYGIESFDLNATQTNESILDSTLMSNGTVNLNDGSTLGYSEVAFAVESKTIDSILVSENIDLSAVVAEGARDIELMDLRGNGDDCLTIQALDVLDITDSNNILMVEGDAGDSVQVASGWVSQGSENGYEHFTMEGSDAHLYLDEEVARLVVNS